MASLQFRWSRHPSYFADDIDGIDDEDADVTTVGNPWKSAWTRAKHLRRAALVYKRLSQETSIHAWDDPNEEHILNRWEWRVAMYRVYERAAHRAGWGCR